MATMQSLSIALPLKPSRTPAAGSGPTLIECRPWVLSGHTESGRHAVRNPILKMEEYLSRKGLFDRKFKSRVMAEFRRELDTAIKRVFSPEKNGSI